MREPLKPPPAESRDWPIGMPRSNGAAPFENDIINANRGIVRLLGSLALPVIAMLSLFATSLVWNEPIDQHTVVLGLLAFALQHPGRWSTSIAGVRPGVQVLSPWLVTSLVLCAIGLALGLVDHFDPQVLFSWFLVTPVVQIAALYSLPGVLSALIGFWRRRHRIVVVGANAAGRSFAKALDQHPIAHSTVVAYFDDRSAARIGPMDGAPLAGTMADLHAYLNRESVDQVYIALPLTSPARIVGLMEGLRDCAADIFFVPEVLAIDMVQPRLRAHAGYPVVSLCESPFRGLSGVQKRGVDLLLASVALVLVAPLMLVIALALTATGQGPVLVRQGRVGMDGREIGIWRFRTTAGSGVGTFLRRTSLDALPMLFNVLAGDMSLVGPQPHSQAVDAQVRALIPRYLVRPGVRPGLTGWAQVHDGTDGDDPAAIGRRVRHELDYLRRWSVWLDMRILASAAWRWITRPVRRR